MARAVPVEWPVPVRGLNTQQSPQHLRADELSDVENMYFQAPDSIRSCGAWERVWTPLASSQISHLWYIDNQLYWRGGGTIYRWSWPAPVPIQGTGSEVDMLGFGSGGKRALYIASDLGLWTYKGGVLSKVTGAKVPHGVRMLKTRTDRLWATGSSDNPCMIFVSDFRDATNWKTGGAVAFKLMAEEGGEIVDWVEYLGSLHVFKTGSPPRVRRLAGYSASTFHWTDELAGTAPISGTARKCANSIMFIAEGGVFDLRSSEAKRLVESNPISEPVESDIRSISSPHCSYFPGINAYLVGGDGADIYVSNLGVAPRVWTKFAIPDDEHVWCMLAANSTLYVGTREGHIWKYNYEGYRDSYWDAGGCNFMDKTVSFTTADWDLSSPSIVKNIRYVEGEFAHCGADNVRISIYKDHETHPSYIINTDGANRVKTNFNVRHVKFKFEFLDLTEEVRFRNFTIGTRSVRENRG